MSEPISEPTSDPETGKADLVKLAVDNEACIGSGMCEMLEEALFLIDEDTNVAGVLGDGLLAADRAAIVIDRCPASAISIVDEREVTT